MSGHNQLKALVSFVNLFFFVFDVGQGLMELVILDFKSVELFDILVLFHDNFLNGVIFLLYILLKLTNLRGQEFNLIVQIL